MTRLTIAMLGEPHVHVDDAPVACPSKKALGLFLYLAQVGGRPSRRELARLFWGADEEAARTSLRTALQRLPAALAQLLVVDRESIGLRPEVLSGIELDTLRFAALARADDVASLTEASQLYGGDLLKNLELDAAPEFDDWLHRERTRYRQLAQSVFDRLIVLHRERAQRDTAHAASAREAAFATARRWVELEPAAESAHRWLMQLFFESGQREAALAQFEVCQRELAIALGRSPDAQTRTLFDAIAAGGVGGLAGSPTPRTPASSPPAIEPTLHAPELAGTSFVGRIDELASLEQLLSDPSCRLLTLHALGGAGKSRLAFALASQVASRFVLGASWVALEPVASAAQLPDAIARALGIELPAQAEPGDALCALLRAQQRLLVLDNFEHLLGSAAVELVLALLREAPGVRLLVTSREVLGLQEEWVYEVPGLAFPAAMSATAPGAFPATELFVQRARQAYLGFSPQAEWPHVLRICRLVEGLPLALELAAAWVRTIPCGDLAQAIETEMTALTGRHRNRPARQHSLDAVVRTSWSLLTREQQHALAPLSMFVGGFTQEAADAIADASLRVLSTLVDKSLVNRRADGRLGLHELVRQFAGAQLAARSSLARGTRRRYASYYAALIERCRALLDGPQDLEAEATLSAELANLMKAAPQWLEDKASVESTAEPTLRMLIGRGLHRQACAFAERLLDGSIAISAATRSFVLTWRAHARMVLGDMAASRIDLDAANALSREHALHRPRVFALLTATLAAAHEDNFARAREKLAEAEPLLALIDDHYLKLRARFFDAVLLDAEGHAAQAEAALRETLKMAGPLGSPVFIATVQQSLAGPLAQQGRFEEAETLLIDAIPAIERAGKQPLLARGLITLAVTMLWCSGTARADAAAAHALRALAIFERAGSSYGEAVAADCLGMVRFAQGRLDEAQALLERSTRAGQPTVATEARLHLAWLLLKRKLRDGAAQQGRELVELAHKHGLAAARRNAILVGAALAVSAPGGSDSGTRWLRLLLGDADLDFEQRRHVEELLGSAGAIAVPLTQTSPDDLLAEVSAFLGPSR